MRLIVVSIAAALLPLQAATEWLKFTSDNFEMYTTAGEKDARRTLEYFEQVRDFFMRVKSDRVTTRLPVTIVAFKNQKEYKPYSPSLFAAAYYMGDEQRDYIVLGGVGMEHYPVAVHEYMHLLIRHSGLRVPSWLNEGLAETYSTLQPLANKMLMGSIPQGRGYALGEHKWIPLDRLLAIEHGSKEFDERDRSSVFYGQSWLLTHMLMLGDGYSKGFSRFVMDLSNNGSAEQAFQRVYGKTLIDVNKDLQAYYRSNSLKGVLFDVKLQKIRVSDPRPATELETGLTLAKLTMLLRRRDEARTRYAELAKAYPENWEIFEALAHVYWRDGDNAQAKANFRKAVELKPTSWKTYWDYARFAQGEPGTVEALRSALRLNPELAEARLMLGYELYRARSFKEAYEVIATIRQVTPDRAPQLFLMKAFSALEIGDKLEARAAAEMAKKYAKSPEDISQAERIIQFVDQKQIAARRPVELQEESVPVQRRAEATQAVEEAVRPATPSNPGLSERLEPRIAGLTEARGILQEFECLGEQARVRILVGQTRMVLLIRDPSSVRLRNSDQSTVDMKCGPQPSTSVIVGFVPKEDAKFKTTGDVVSLDFLTKPARR
jgi:tetratricopeptide (TPR) repeat protein